MGRARPLLPPRPFLDALVVRVALAWVFIRVAAAVITVVMDGDPAPTPASAFWILLVVIAVLRVETARRSELLLLANLGHSFGRIASFAAAQVLMLEALMQVALV